MGWKILPVPSGTINLWRLTFSTILLPARRTCVWLAITVPVLKPPVTFFEPNDILETSPLVALFAICKAEPSVVPFFIFGAKVGCDRCTDAVGKGTVPTRKVLLVEFLNGGTAAETGSLVPTGWVVSSELNPKMAVGSRVFVTVTALL